MSEDRWPFPPICALCGERRNADSRRTTRVRLSDGWRTTLGIPVWVHVDCLRDAREAVLIEKGVRW